MLRMPGKRNSAQGASLMERMPRYRTSRVPVSNPTMSNDKERRDWPRLAFSFVVDMAPAMLVFVIAFTSVHPA